MNSRVTVERPAVNPALTAPTIRGRALPVPADPMPPDLEAVDPLLSEVRQRIASGRMELPIASPLRKHAEALHLNVGATIDDLLPIVEGEPAVASAIMRLANGKRPNNLREALAAVGTEEARDAILRIAHRGGDPPEAAAHHLRRVWTNTLFTAVAAREISRWLNHPDPEAVYLAALFHNSGEPILVNAFAERDPDDITVFYSSDVVFAAVRESHAEIGRCLLGSWHFPQDVVELAGRHEGPINCELTAIVAAAIEAALDYGYTYLDVYPNHRRLHRALAYLGLSKHQLDGLPEVIGEELNRALTMTG